MVNARNSHKDKVVFIRHTTLFESFFHAKPTTRSQKRCNKLETFAGYEDHECSPGQPGRMLQGSPKGLHSFTNRLSVSGL
jgi:hypothetical protein